MSSQTLGSSPQMQLVCCVTLNLAHYLSRLLQLSGRGWREPDSEEVSVGVALNVSRNSIVGRGY